MKKLFLALSVLAMLIFAAVPSQALVSMPDAVPGQDILVPFFLAKITSGESTLVVVQEVHGNATTMAVNVFDIASTSRHDTTETLTGYDVGAWNVRDNWIANASSTDRTALEIDLDGDTVNDHYAGYVTMVNATADSNGLAGFIYQIDLASGVASGALAVSEEYERTAQVTTDGMVDASFIELYNANALAAAQQRIASITGAVTAATTFAMYPRYYIYDANGQNYLFSWRDTVDTQTSHLDFYDTAELSYSANVTLTHELDILNIRDILPAGHMTAYPYAGFIKYKIPDKAGSTLTGTDQWIMYSLQRVTNTTAGTSWNALYDVHREAGTGATTY